MKVSCDIIGDLLPLVAENMASDASRKLVEEHLMDCHSCREQYESLKKHTSEEMVTSQGDEMALSTVKEEIRHRRRNSVMLVACLVFLVVFTVFSQLTAPQYLPYSEGLLSIEKSADGTVYGTFSSEVTAYQIRTVQGENLEIELTAWTTVWDQLFGKIAQTVQLCSPEQPVDTVWYCSGTGEPILIYGAAPDGGRIVLPRLVLGYYAFIAVIATAALGILWMLVRKRSHLHELIGRLALVPLAYLIGHLCVKGISTQSFWASRDFVMILIAGIAAYLLMISAIKAIKNRRRDHLDIEERGE